MKKIYYLCVSFSLGFMVASCQNGLEEVINESAVQDELAITRAEIDTPSVDTDLTVIKEFTGMEDEDAILEALESYTYSTGSISGNYIIGGTDIVRYSVSYPSGTDSLHWVYNTNIFSEVSRGNAWIKLQLVNPSCTTDATIIAYAYDSGEITTVYSKSLGVNGPRTNDNSSLSIYRTSDSSQVYPFYNGAPFSANTYYNGYFSCNYTITVTDWDFGGHATISGTPNSYCHFLTDNSTWWYLEIKGTMSPYNVEKTLFTAWLYGQ